MKDDAAKAKKEAASPKKEEPKKEGEEVKKEGEDAPMPVKEEEAAAPVAMDEDVPQSRG